MFCVICLRERMINSHIHNFWFGSRCHEDPSSHQCKKKVSAILPVCKHEIFKACHMDVNECPCSKRCSNRLPCGHVCGRRCHPDDDPDHLKYICRKKCIREYKGCPRKEHPCRNPCYKECEACQVPVETDLPCGHRCNIPCSDDPVTFRCQRNCERIMTCGHKCPFICWVTCKPSECEQLVVKEAPCGHTRKMKCNVSVEKYKCVEPCLRKLACGHPCTAKCYYDCTQVLCKTIVESHVSPACTHPKIKILCHQNKTGLQGGSDELLQLCEQPCGKQMSCGHQCKGTCGMCMQGRLHVPCDEKCNKILFCGHECTFICSKLCPPCTTKKCLYRCPHRECLNKFMRNHECFKLCEACYKPCAWACKHQKCEKKCWEDCEMPPCSEPCLEMLSCGHRCIGYCGDPCPPLCVICNQDDPAISANPTARYVKLVDCSHIIESSVMDALVPDATRNNTFRLMICPHQDCSVPVANTLRYRHVYFGFRRQVVEINNIVRGDEVVLLLKKHARYSRLLASGPTVSSSMNKLMKFCSKPFNYHNWEQQDQQNRSCNLRQEELERLILGCLIQPLAASCVELKIKKNTKDKLSEESDGKLMERKERLRYRLEYLAKCIELRMDQINYHTIQEIELVVLHVLRLMSDRTMPLSWYDITPYSWEVDRQMIAEYTLKPLAKLSATLRTRDSSKQWFLCDNQHLYVHENGESCVTCEEKTEEHKGGSEKGTNQRLKQKQKQKLQTKWPNAVLGFRHKDTVPLRNHVVQEDNRNKQQQLL